jgi:hypothetical protein
MYSVKDEATVIVKYFTLPFNLVLYLCRLPESKCTLGINATSPENKLIAILFLEL